MTASETAIEETPFVLRQATCMYEGGYNLFIYFRGVRVASKLSRAEEWNIEEELSETAIKRVKEACEKVDVKTLADHKERQERHRYKKAKAAENLSKRIEEAL